jgi:hypothetical protein
MAGDTSTFGCMTTVSWHLTSATGLNHISLVISRCQSVTSPSMESALLAAGDAGLMTVQVEK